MKKILLILGVFFTIQLNAFTSNFYSLGLGKSELSSLGEGFTERYNKTNPELILEYGYDNKEFYRIYLDSNLNKNTQGASLMIEWAPRFDVFPSYFKTILGIPNLYLGFGMGYNRVKVRDESINTSSFDSNFGLMFEFKKFIIKIGEKSKDYKSISGHGTTDSSTKYITLQYFFQ